MVRKVVDSRVHTLIKNCVQQKQRAFFVIVGDRGKDQVVNLHWMLSQAQVAARPSVLWCYKKDLGFTSHRRKREKKIKYEIKKGLREPNEEDPFELFVSVTNIRYTYYKETQKILGNTFGMCVLQDFEALTPNLLARTIETVEGGGIVVMLLKTMSSLKQLYSMTMDVHSRYRTEAHHDVVARFNERFLLSLGSCPNCLVVDDELNVLPISMGKHTKPLPATGASEAISPQEQELRDLKESLADTQPVGTLVSMARTLDQAKAVMTFVDVVADKTLRSTVTLTAARGRGKSAALGIVMASAVAYGYSNIFVTSPSPENLNTLFEFVFKAFDALGYEEHMDYDIVQSTNPNFNKAIVRVNIFRQHRQTIQYIQPQDAHTLGQAELLVIDEAAAIPLPLVKKLMGPYLVFMASTINGYEGTGRSLSLKLIQQLREQSRGFSSTSEADASGSGALVDREGRPRKTETGSLIGGRILKETKLEEPIRYAAGDPVEEWLNRLLCLDVTAVTKNIQGCPHPSECELYYVNRDTLFSYHPVSEMFLQRMMALYVASHYKNSPNDLQLLSDAPGHHLFVLLPPVSTSTNTLPDPLCVIQVCLEGRISRQSILSNLSRGNRPSGDLIPWVISQQFQDSDFASLSGARVVRIATHPDYIGMGYGARALEQLRGFYSGEFHSLSESDNPDVDDTAAESLSRLTDAELENTSLQTDQIQVRDPRKMPPLLLQLSEKRAPRLHYLGVSYGVTASLYKFWKRSGFVPVYLRQTPNELTGEHTCVMLHALPVDEQAQSVVVDPTWLSAFAEDFHRRFLHLLSYQFRQFTSVTALGIMEAARNVKQIASSENEPHRLDTPIRYRPDLYRILSPFDLKRLESFSNSLLDYHVVMDLFPLLADLYFNGRLLDFSSHSRDAKGQRRSAGPLTLSSIQSGLFLAIGLQHKSVDEIEAELNLPNSQILGMLVKISKKIYASFKYIMNEEVDDETVAVAGSTPSLIASASRGKPLDKTEDTATKKRALPTTTHRNLDLDKENEAEWDPVPESLDDDLDQAGKAYLSTFREKQKDMIDSLDLGQYAIAGNTNDWARAEAQIAKDGASSVVSVKNPESTKKRKQKAVMDELIKEGERSVKTPSKKKGRSGKRHSTR